MGGEFKESMCGEWSKRFSLNGNVRYFSSLKNRDYWLRDRVSPLVR